MGRAYAGLATRSASASHDFKSNCAGTDRPETEFATCSRASYGRGRTNRETDGARGDGAHIAQFATVECESLTEIGTFQVAGVLGPNEAPPTTLIHAPVPSSFIGTNLVNNAIGDPLDGDTSSGSPMETDTDVRRCVEVVDQEVVVRRKRRQDLRTGLPDEAERDGLGLSICREIADSRRVLTLSVPERAGTVAAPISLADTDRAAIAS